MLFESESFHGEKLVNKTLGDSGDSIYRYCELEVASVEGGNFGDTFLSCEFREVDWYWGLFNLALFHKCNFTQCTFRGTTFADCKFVECTFTDCRFIKDNLGGGCSAPGTKLFDCTEQKCEGWNELFS